MSKETKKTNVTEAAPWPFLGRWSDLVGYLASPAAQKENNPATLNLRLLIRDLFAELRKAIDDPLDDRTTWKEPYLAFKIEYPFSSEVDAINQDTVHIRALIEILMEGKAVFKKNGEVVPVLLKPLFESISLIPERDRTRLAKEWIDIEEWKQPTFFADKPGEYYSIAGYRTNSREAQFGASLAFAINPRMVDLDSKELYDHLEVGLPWRSPYPPDTWKEEERETLWRTADDLLNALVKQAEEGTPPPECIRNRVPPHAGATFQRFEARCNTWRGKNLTERLAFRPFSTALSRVPTYARGIKGPILDIMDGNGSLKVSALFDVLAVMLYPEDEKARRRYLANNRMRVIQSLRDYIEESGLIDEANKEAGVELSATDWWQLFILQSDSDWLKLSPELIGEALSSPPSADMDEEARRRAACGSIVGEILTDALTCAKHHPEYFSIENSIRLRERIYSDREEHEDARLPRKRSALYRTWGTFRDVAHLWAASNLGVTKGEEWSPVGDMLKFLAVAELTRKAAESTFARAQGRKHGPILDPSKTWRTPPDLALPEIAVWSDPLPKWALDLLVKPQDT